MRNSINWERIEAVISAKLSSFHTGVLGVGVQSLALLCKGHKGAAVQGKQQPFVSGSDTGVSYTGSPKLTVAWRVRQDQPY